MRLHRPLKKIDPSDWIPHSSDRENIFVKLLPWSFLCFCSIDHLQGGFKIPFARFCFKSHRKSNPNLMKCLQTNSTDCLEMTLNGTPGQSIQLRQRTLPFDSCGNEQPNSILKILTFSFGTIVEKCLPNCQTQGIRNYFHPPEFQSLASCKNCSLCRNRNL